MTASTFYVILGLLALIWFGFLLPLLFEIRANTHQQKIANKIALYTSLYNASSSNEFKSRYHEQLAALEFEVDE